MKRTVICVLLLFSLGTGNRALAIDGKEEAKTPGFTFAIIADPQLSARDAVGNSGALEAQRNLEKICLELNAMDPQPDFTLFLGDLVNVFNERSVDNFRQCIEKLKSDVYLVHGNHDTKAPYTGFLDLHRQYNPQISREFYAFEHKGWLFVALPCVNELTDELTIWLDQVLHDNKDKPVIILEHFPLLPIGLSQLEFYTFRIRERVKLMDILTRYGNVRYYFNGHVHNGVKTSIKTSWNYKGIDFITVPTVIAVRPFGEELSGFDASNRGGFYLTLTIDTDKLEIAGRQAGVDYIHKYGLELQPYSDEVEPRWFKTINELRVAERIINADFSAGMMGWTEKYRYKRDEDPVYVCMPITKKGKPWLQMSVRSAEPSDWADDEYHEAYQLIKVGRGQDVRLLGSYAVNGFTNGGGFIRVTAFDTDGKPYIFMFKWGENEEDASYVPRCLGFELHGNTPSWNFLREAGAEKAAIFVNLEAEPGKEYAINADLGALYDSAMQVKGAFNQLGIEKLYVGVGVWANKTKGAYSHAYFTNIYAGPDSLLSSNIPTVSTYQPTFDTDFGKSLDERVKARNAR